MVFEFGKDAFAIWQIRSIRDELYQFKILINNKNF